MVHHVIDDLEKLPRDELLAYFNELFTKRTEDISETELAIQRQQLLPPPPDRCYLLEGRIRCDDGVSGVDTVTLRQLDQDKRVIQVGTIGLDFRTTEPKYIHNGHSRPAFDKNDVRQVYRTLARRVQLLEDNGVRIALFGGEHINHLYAGLLDRLPFDLPTIPTPYCTPSRGSMEEHLRPFMKPDQHFPLIASLL